MNVEKAIKNIRNALGFTIGDSIATSFGLHKITSIKVTEDNIYFFYEMISLGSKRICRVPFNEIFPADKDKENESKDEK